MSQTARTQARAQRKARRQAQRELRKQQRKAGMRVGSHTSRPNRGSPYQTVEEERQGRTEAVVQHARLIRRLLPPLLKRLSQIPDPRKPLLLKHKLTTLMVYGILMFVLHNSSRRKTNDSFTAPAMKEALMELFPDLQSMPHHETLARLLRSIAPEAIEAAQAELVAKLIHDKKFIDYLLEGHYPIAIDGTQKLVRSLLPDEGWLQRKVGAEGKKHLQYYVYVLEANLVLSSGLSIPLMSEFLDYREGDSERDKQDCELRGFRRLAARLKSSFPHLSILLLLDGEFANGPVMGLCRQYGWRFMTVLKDASLPYVWQEYNALRPLLTEEQRLSQIWGQRHQSFQFVNHIDYEYEQQGHTRRVTLHLVVCEESWQEVEQTGSVVERHSKWAWISNLPFTRESLHRRCNRGGRHRWGIEFGILVEKHQGYQYEHCYAEDWNAMRGYHYLMRIAHLLNSLASVSSGLIALFAERGPQGFIEWLRATLSGNWLLDGLQDRLAAPLQLRLLLPLPLDPVSSG